MSQFQNLCKRTASFVIIIFSRLNEYGMLVLVCFGWQKNKIRYCLLSAGL